MTHKKSRKAFAEASEYIPGGVNSPVRALRAVGETPIFIDRAKGVTLTDIDGNHYTDFCLSWGVFIAGHANDSVLQAVSKAVQRGTSYGIPTLLETELAKRVSWLIPGMEQVRFVNSGTEAVMSAIRLARGYTRRNYILKFEGCYHGHADHLLVAAGSGVATQGRSNSAGVPDDFVKYTLTAPFNDKEAVKKLFAQYGSDIATVIVEPVPANMGVVPEEDGFLHFLRAITREHGSLLLFDEVITGFRLTLGGAQQYYGIEPDLTTVGKIVGGGFPAAAFGGRREIMQLLAPVGPVYQAGTLSGNPIAMTAGIATLDILSQPDTYEQLNDKAERFISRMQEVLEPKGVVVNHVGNMFTPYFTGGNRPRNFQEVRQSNLDEFARFWRYMFNNGVYLSPSQFEADFISIQHTEAELDKVIELAREYRGNE
ncbi:MAG: glutamate-1-semialdehyde 2,1-aminomutase [Prevotella sp.]|nr:glutamate-1-semialdehyde 2,1-aminomutase [Prevotella sp.]